LIDKEQLLQNQIDLSNLYQKIQEEEFNLIKNQHDFYALVGVDFVDDIKMKNIENEIISIIEKYKSYIDSHNVSIENYEKGRIFGKNIYKKDGSLTNKYQYEFNILKLRKLEYQYFVDELSKCLYKNL
jgi:hypothetical protein